VDTKKKQAFFTMQRRIRDRYDPDFEEWSYKTVSKEVAIPYDFLHITPPMHPPQALRDSPLAVTSGTDKGYAHVDRDHMRHKIFGNVFAVGDCAGTPLGKTAFSAKNQALTVTRNILNILLHKPLVSYDGYSGCPIKLSYDNLLFAEFDYDGATKRLLSAPCIPKHSLWEYDRYRLPKHYWDWLHGEIHSS
jgi:sulfide:quinone oxidoreductase